MKSKVILPFNDKHTGKHHNPGDVIDITVERFNEIRNKGKYIEPIEEVATVKPEPPKKEDKKN